MSDKRIYITTTLPYVNADPHIGHAVEFIRADVIARFEELSGKKVFFNTGTDEHGLKIFRAAEAQGKQVQAYVDESAKKFSALHKALGLKSDVNVIRTTNPGHIEAATEFWQRCNDHGYIYKKKYSAKYCVGCELEKTDSELQNGRCPIHPNLELETIEEENYFFKFSEFQEKLLKFYDAHPNFVVPRSRFNEIKAFVSRGLKDFSVSRLKSKMPWGIEVPGDPTQIMYVWFDALVSYIAALGWPRDEDKFNLWWRDAENVIQYCGKDNLRQQSAMWQAMLMAAGLPNSKQIVIDGFVTGEGGIKMSKSLGNTVDPLAVVKEYGTDALRYFVAREIHPFEDSPFTMERFKEAYNGSLANGLGNLVSRVMKMASSNNIRLENYTKTHPGDFEKNIKVFNLKSALDSIWTNILYLDGDIQGKKPFIKIKTDPEGAKKDIQFLLNEIKSMAELLLPFLPETSEKILNCIKENKMPEATLFPRKD